MKKITKMPFLVISSAILISCGGTTQSSNVVSNESGKGETISSSQVITSADRSSISYEEEPVGNTTLEGYGTENSPYIIKTKDDLKEFNQHPVLNKRVYYELGASIEWDDEWSPVGALDNPFVGSFDGNGYSITGLKITDFSKDQTLYGFFGLISKCKASNLELGLTVDLSMLGKESKYAVGGLAAYATNSSIDNVHVNYESCDIVTAQNNESYLYVGGIVSYFSSESDRWGTYYASITKSSVKGNISVDLTDSDDVVDAEGGIVAVMDTNSYDGIIAVNNCAFYGDIRGGMYVGGIAADMANYSSIVNCYVESNSIGSYINNFSYVGGVVGAGVSDSAVLKNYANVSHVVGTDSPSTVYESYAGDVIGAIAYDGYDEYIDTLGTAVFGNWSSGGTISNSEHQRQAEFTDEYSASSFKKVGFSDIVWNADETTATIKKDASDYMVKLSVNLNGGKGDSTELGLNAGIYNNDQHELYTTFEGPVRKGYSYYGLFYDQEGTVEWRWYAPINADLTIYCGYAFLSDLTGDWKAMCTYYENQISSGTWKFTDERFYWLFSDGSYSEYKYHFNGTYIFIDEYQGKFSESMGAYEDTMLKLTEEGTITGNDINDESATYAATKEDTDVSVPTLKDEPFLGTWKTDTLEMTIYEDCTVTAHNFEGSMVNYFGGAKYDGTTLTITVSGRIDETKLTYDQTTDTLVGEGVTWTRG